LNSLGTLARDEGDREKARDYFTRALNIYKKFLPPDHPDIRTVQENLEALG
jgi:hypothetical protein